MLVYSTVCAVVAAVSANEVDKSSPTTGHIVIYHAGITAQVAEDRALPAWSEINGGKRCVMVDYTCTTCPRFELVGLQCT